MVHCWEKAACVHIVQVDKAPRMPNGEKDVCTTRTKCGPGS